MLKRLAVVALALVLAAPIAALACTCLWAGPFTKVALGADLIVLAEVRAYERHGMEVTVLDVLKGEEVRNVIKIWGDDGALCRPYVSNFPLRTRWIFALHREREPGSRDYVISGCGAFWLAVQSEQAIGLVNPYENYKLRESLPLAQVVAWVRSGGTTALTPRRLR
jgi:hypothetical protein